MAIRFAAVEHSISMAAHRAPLGIRVGPVDTRTRRDLVCTCCTQEIDTDLCRTVADASCRWLSGVGPSRELDSTLRNRAQAKSGNPLYGLRNHLAYADLGRAWSE